MFINAVGCYIPEQRVPNDYFLHLNGLTSDWIFQRTGILTRSKAKEGESLNDMCIAAVENALPQLPYSIQDIDLIIFASYTPEDTVGTTAHIIQQKYNIDGAKAFLLSSACSSAMNAMEIIKSFFETNRSKKALLISADKNSSFSNESDPSSGHLWGDAATSVFFSKERISDKEPEVMDVASQALGNIGRGPQGVLLNTKKEKGLEMPHGKDIFMQACIYIAKNTEDILTNNGYSLADLSYFIGHQANMRILSHVTSKLGIPEEKILSNIKELGNTGSVSAILVFVQNFKKFQKDDIVCLSVFGGGYSAGACLIKF